MKPQGNRCYLGKVLGCNGHRGTYIYKSVFSYFGGKYQEEELLDHMVVLPVFRGTSILFPIVTALIYIPTV